MSGTDLHLLVEMMCGAPAGFTPHPPARAPTPIERRFFEFASQSIGKALCEILKLESADNCMVLSGEEAGALEAGATRFAFRGRLEWRAFGGKIGLLVEGFQDLLDRCAVAESPPVVVDWAPEVQAHLQTREILLTAMIEDRSLTLGQIENCRVGAKLELAAGPRTLVSLAADGAPLFLCQLGQGSGHYNVRIHSEASQRGVKRSWMMEEAGLSEEQGAQPDALHDFAGKRAAALSRIPVLVQVVLGSANMSISRMEQLAPGAVIRLDKKIGEKVDVLVNGELLGRGDIAILEDEEPRFAVSLTEIASADEPTAG